MPLACTQCCAAKAKCDHGDPCSRCQKLGLKCYTRKRKPYKKNRKNGKKRAAAAAAAAAASPRPKKKTKTEAETALEKGGGTTDITKEIKQIKEASERFVGVQVDLTGFQALKHLSPSHWGLRCAVICLMSIGFRKMNLST